MERGKLVLGIIQGHGIMHGQVKIQGHISFVLDFDTILLVAEKHCCHNNIEYHIEEN